MSEKLSRQGLYPIADRVPLARLVGEAVSLNMSSVGIFPQKFKARWNGEFRCPRKGEWYLSGAIITCYHAPNDLSMSYHIAEIVEVETVTVTHVVRTFGNEN